MSTYLAPFLASACTHHPSQALRTFYGGIMLAFDDAMQAQLCSELDRYDCCPAMKALAELLFVWIPLVCELN